MGQLIEYATLGGDQYLSPLPDLDYDTVHDSAGRYLTTAKYTMNLGQYTNVNSYHFIFRQAWIFDTSVIPTTGVILSAKISFMLGFDYSDTDFNITIVSGADIADDGLVWQDYGDLLNDTVSRGRLSTSGLSLNTYYDIRLNSIGKSEITKGGLTKFGVRSSRDISGTAPASLPEQREYVHTWSTQQSGKGVKLTVNYATEPGFIWIDGRRFYFISEVDKKHIEGRYAGVYGATAGYLYVEGLYLVYIDEAGHKRKRKGYKKGVTGVDVSTGCPIWVEKTKIRYVDANGNERFLPIWWFNTDVFNRAVFNG